MILKNHIVIKILLVLVVLMIVYFSGSLYYMNKFSENVYINGVNVSRKSLEEADKELMEKNSWENTIIKSDTENFLEIKAEEIDYKYLGSPDLPQLYKEQNEWKWFLSIFKDSIYTIPTISEYNEESIKNKIDEIKELDKELTDARIVYSNNSDEFVIENHSYELQITKEEILNLVIKSIESGDNEVNLEEYIEQPSIYSDDEGLIQARDEANEYLDFQIIYDFGDREEIIDRFILKDFITFDARERLIDPERVEEYVAELARKYDTFGGRRSFYTSRGQSKIVSGGSYGWLIYRTKTQEELIKYLENGESKTIEPVYSYRALTRNLDDIGDSYVEIDLTEQMVYVYLGGQLRVETQTVTGNLLQGYATPTGVYPINYKERDATLRGEDYASPVKYWMPFNRDIGLHDADWRTSFGGDIYETNGSHGCINLPPNNAEIIFNLVYPGMPVVVH